ncbi:Epsilon-trimethyllysine 2-oxoglutarate dioxygenase [Aphelenchoides besseyi]|nr:Epsilon-trimethyllysine 2-oxoglutarate dioxygenase [Aphelenchoides besseyi]KAI6209139.1 Epsilon-trimethyllysine 2-oxoglutarate dioxygenase [Aphelenchoides besseyi]
MSNVRSSLISTGRQFSFVFNQRPLTLARNKQVTQFASTLTVSSASELLNSTNQNETISNVRLIDATDPKNISIELELVDESEILRIPLVWLRDHCRSPLQFNYLTGQRRTDPTQMFAKAKLASSSNDTQSPLKFDSRNQTLQLKWADGHQSEFTAKKLLDWAVFTRRDYDDIDSRSYWTKSTLREIPNVSVTHFDFSLFARLFCRFGVVLVTGVDARNEKATKQLCESVAPLHEMLGGDFWVVETADGGQGTGEDYEVEARCNRTHDKHAHDTISPSRFGPHTASAFLDQTPGIRCVHVLKSPEDGGKTRLVDGFSVAQKLRDERAELFELLATIPVEHHRFKNAPKKQRRVKEEDDSDYPMDFKRVGRSRGSSIVTAVEPPEPQQPPIPVHARAIHRPVIERFKEKIVQIRFSPADRAPLRSLRVVEGFDNEAATINAERTIRFYEAYQRFAQLAHDDAATVEIDLKPGNVLFIDNYRVLHALDEYVGTRKMCGCYLSRDGAFLFIQFQPSGITISILALLAKARPVLSAAYRNV